MVDTQVTKKPEEQQPRADKFAVFLTNPASVGPVSSTLAQLGISRITCYSQDDWPELCDAIGSGTIAGALAIGVDAAKACQLTTEMRGDLKSRFSKFPMAQFRIYPANLEDPRGLFYAFTNATKVHTQAMPEMILRRESNETGLVPLMHPVAEGTVVTVIDRDEIHLRCIESILSHWPGLSATYTPHYYDMEVIISRIEPRTKLLIIEEKLEGTNGSKIAESLVGQGFDGRILHLANNGIVRDITDKTGGWVFSGKELLSRSQIMAELFVATISALLRA